MADVTTTLEQVETICTAHATVDVLLVNGERVRIWIDGTPGDARIDLDIDDARLLMNALGDALAELGARVT